MESVYEYGKSIVGWLRSDTSDPVESTPDETVSAGWIYVVPGEEGDYPSTIDVPTLQEDAEEAVTPSLDNQDIQDVVVTAALSTEESVTAIISRTIDSTSTTVEGEETRRTYRIDAGIDIVVIHEQQERETAATGNHFDGEEDNSTSTAEWRLWKSPKATARRQRKLRQHPHKLVKREKIQQGSMRFRPQQKQRNRKRAL